MKVLVTGASGFVGSRLTARLARRGHEVFGTAIDGGRAGDGIEIVAADLTDREAVGAIVDQVGPDRVVHLAALSHVGASWSQVADYFRVNVMATEYLLAAVDVPVVFASSAEIYGAVPDEDQPIPESRPPAPASPYALTKAAAERLVLGAGGIVVRPFNLVGPGQASCFALPAFAEQLAAVARGDRRPVLEVGNLEARRDFVHVDDGVDAFTLLLEKGEAGEVYNVASGRAWSLREALSQLRQASGQEVRLEIDAERFRPVDVPLMTGDATRLRALGWQPRRDLRQAVADLWAERAASPASAG